MLNRSMLISKAPLAPKLTDSLWAVLGAFIAIGGTMLLTSASGYSWLMAPFGATCVLVFGLPDSPLAQPRSVIGGHLVSAMIGLILLMILGNDWWVQSLAVGLAILGMQQTRTVHAPAGATPLVVMSTAPAWSFLFFPVLAGAIFIVLVACVSHHFRQKRSYPKYWF